jgi:hypothetical protein
MYLRIKYLLKESTLEDLLSIEEIIKKLVPKGLAEVSQVASDALSDFNYKPSRISLYVLRLFNPDKTQHLLAVVFPGALSGKLAITADACKLFERNKDIARSFCKEMNEQMVLDCWRMQQNDAMVYWFQA